MSLPWTGKTGHAKLATIFATGFLVSLGLCGVNFVTVMSGFSGHPVLPNLLFITAWIELAGMGVCLIGLLVVGLMALSDAVSRRSAARQNPPEDKP